MAYLCPLPGACPFALSCFDLSKTFNTIDGPLLLDGLEYERGLEGTALQWFNPGGGNQYWSSVEAKSKHLLSECGVLHD